MKFSNEAYFQHFFHLMIPLQHASYLFQLDKTHAVTSNTVITKTSIFQVITVQIHRDTLTKRQLHTFEDCAKDVFTTRSSSIETRSERDKEYFLEGDLKDVISQGERGTGSNISSLGKERLQWDDETRR